MRKVLKFTQGYFVHFKNEAASRQKDIMKIHKKKCNIKIKRKNLVIFGGHSAYIRDFMHSPLVFSQ